MWPLPTSVPSYIRKFLLAHYHTVASSWGERLGRHEGMQTVFCSVCRVPSTVGSYSAAVVSHNTNNHHIKVIDCPHKNRCPKESCLKEIGGSLEQATEMQEFTTPLEAIWAKDCSACCLGCAGDFIFQAKGD